MAIKEAIELEGSDEVKATIADLTKTVQGLTDQINNIQAPDTGSTEIDKLVVNIGHASAALDDHTTHVNKTTEAYHILHPLLQATGLQFGELRSFALLANTSLVALAGVGLAAVVVKMSELQDESTRAKNILSDLFGSAEAGAKAFESSEAAAIKFGATTSQVTAPLETLTKAYDNFVASQSKGKFVGLDPDGKIVIGIGNLANKTNELTKANENLFKLLLAGGDDAAKATQQANAFFATFDKGGKLTADALKSLPVGTVEQLSIALGKGDQAAASFINQVATGFNPTIVQTTKALADFQTQSDKAFDTKAVIGFQSELTRIQETLTRGFTQLVGVDISTFLVGQLEKVRIQIQNVIDDVNKLKAIFAAGFGALPTGVQTGLSTAADLAQQAGNLNPTSLFFNPGAALSTLTNFWKTAIGGFNQLGDAAKTSATTTENAWKTVGTQIQSSVDNPLKAAGDSGTSFADKIVAALKSVGSAAGDTAKKVDQIRQTFAGGTAATFGAGAFVTPPGGALPTGVETAAKAAAQIPGLPKPADVNDLTTAFNALKPALDDTASTISRMSDMLRTATESGDRFAAALQNAADVSFSSVVSQLQTIAQTFQEIVNSMQQIQSSGAAPATFAQRFGFATGGLFRGRPGIDSNLAWMTDYEYVMQPSAVRKYGIGFLEAINNMLLPLDWFDRLRGYAAGGLVTSSSSNPTPLHLHFPGVPGSFEVAASENTAASLRKHAVRARLFSTGRKPSWY